MRYSAQNLKIHDLEEYRDLIIEVIAVFTAVLLWNLLLTAPVF